MNYNEFVDLDFIIEEGRIYGQYSDGSQKSIPLDVATKLLNGMSQRIRDLDDNREDKTSPCKATSNMNYALESGFWLGVLEGIRYNSEVPNWLRDLITEIIDENEVRFRGGSDK